MCASVFFLFLFQRFNSSSCDFKVFLVSIAAAAGYLTQSMGQSAEVLTLGETFQLQSPCGDFLHFLHHPDGSGTSLLRTGTKKKYYRVLVASIPKTHQNIGTCSTCEVLQILLDSLDMFGFTLSSCR